MTNTSAYECQVCGVELEQAVGICHACWVEENTHRLKQWVENNRLARKPQDFDTSPLPLFGDSHKQRELF